MRRSVVTYMLIVLLLFFTVIYAIPIIIDIFQPRVNSLKPAAGPYSESNNTLVPLEAHIMSKCPDAKDCLVDLVVPAMEQISDKVDFRLSFIGEVDDSNTVHCKHGATECLGNMMSLCADDLYPNNVKISLGFSTCLILSYQKIPQRSLVEYCALEHGIPFEDINACISEEGKGLDLLEASVERTDKANVKKSCTVRVGGEKWCIRDGAEWKDCDAGHEVKDLVKEINTRYQKSSP